MLGLLILAAFLVYYRHGPTPRDCSGFPSSCSCSWCSRRTRAVVGLTVHFRDIRDLLANLLMLWFFATPIIYSVAGARTVAYTGCFDLNPFTHLAVAYQETCSSLDLSVTTKWLALGGGRARLPRVFVAADLATCMTGRRDTRPM
ncbi:MAG: hypothetical protein QM736_06950 [Vicinamibacterales bacterium]